MLIYPFGARLRSVFARFYVMGGTVCVFVQTVTARFNFQLSPNDRRF